MIFAGTAADSDVAEAKVRVAELQTALQVGLVVVRVYVCVCVCNCTLQRLVQKRSELQSQEQQLTRERGSLSQQFEAESNALYEASKHVRLSLLFMPMSFFASCCSRPVHVSELQLRLDAVKQEAGANKVKLQVSSAAHLAFSRAMLVLNMQITLHTHVSTCSCYHRGRHSLLNGNKRSLKAGPSLYQRVPCSISN
jgi:hypothetical protein